MSLITITTRGRESYIARLLQLAAIHGINPADAIGMTFVELAAAIADARARAS